MKKLNTTLEEILDFWGMELSILDTFWLIIDELKLLEYDEYDHHRLNEEGTSTEELIWSKTQYSMLQWFSQSIK